MLYRDGFLNLIQFYTNKASLPTSGHKHLECKVWNSKEIYRRVIERAFWNPAFLLSDVLEREFMPIIKTCKPCSKLLKEWLGYMQSRARHLPPFSSFM